MNCFVRCFAWAPNTSRRAGFDDLPAIEKDHVAGDRMGEAQIVRRHQHGRALAHQLRQHFDHLAGELGAERRGVGPLRYKHAMRLQGALAVPAHLAGCD
jgi:hypothetical protein